MQINGLVRGFGPLSLFMRRFSSLLLRFILLRRERGERRTRFVGASGVATGTGFGAAPERIDLFEFGLRVLALANISVSSVWGSGTGSTILVIFDGM